METMATHDLKNSPMLENNAQQQQQQRQQSRKQETKYSSDTNKISNGDHDDNDMIRKNTSNHDSAFPTAATNTITTDARHFQPVLAVSSEGANHSTNALEGPYTKQNQAKDCPDHTMHQDVHDTNHISNIPPVFTTSHYHNQQQQQLVGGGYASVDMPSYSGHGEGFTPPPIVEHNVGVTSKDDGVSEYSDASLNGRKDSLQDGEGNEGDHHHDDDYDEDADEDEDDDEQPVKLFIGQVPKQMEEPDLFAIFEKYGPMEDVAIIRDKHTGQHRGCAFVTFLQKESAELCEKELHGTFVFEGGKRPVQVRPAGWKEDNKIFVGMLPKDVTEEMVYRVFEPYGEITGVFVIQSTDGYRKGCAFVKYVNRIDAHKAIEELHNKVVFENSDRPLIVKIADSKKDKNKTSLHNPAPKQGRYPSSKNSSGHGSDTNLFYSDNIGGVSNASPQMNPLSQDVYYMPPLHGPMGIAHPSSSHQQQTHGHLSHHPVYPGHLHGMEHMGHVALPMEHALPHNHESSLEHFSPPPIFPSHAFPIAYMEHGYDHSSQHHHPSRAPHPHPFLSPQQQMALQSNARPREGPAGANLFIYHLPHDLTDADLATAFNPFGNVISAKVFVDKVTGESKGFGFVSYDSVISAEQAIELMNGFQIGNKRLKVQHKRIHHHPRHAQTSVPMPAAGPTGLVPGVVGIGEVPNQMHHHHHQSPYMYAYTVSTSGHQHEHGMKQEQENTNRIESETAVGFDQTKVSETGQMVMESNIHSREGTNQTQVTMSSQGIVDDLTQQFHNRLSS